MLLAWLLLLSTPSDPRVYDGRSGNLAVQVPRVEAGITVDGALDEPAWSVAALLTGFSQYAPSDGVAAADSTEVLVWYTPSAIYFGIRAFELHGQVHATLADRDRIDTDDYVQILLGTFNDGRQATVFAVNPFGVQADGTMIETGRASSGFSGGGSGGREPVDLSQDFVFESKGRLTAYGYEIEIRIPFKSLRYQSTGTQDWGINVLRRVQHSAYEDSWTPAMRASASFLGQSGTLVGLTGLRRGLVVDLNPELTAKVDGSTGSNGWRYDAKAPEIGGNIRWGITNNLTLNGTVKPDFSQVESDVGQFAFDPRQALYFPEKRPFFLDGIEQFNTPNQLIYTRRIVQPVTAVKLTGKVSGTDLALLSAVDDQAGSSAGTDNPIYNLVRIQRDVGRQSRLGLAYTDRESGSDYNRVGSLDSRLVLSRIATAQFQLAGSVTRENGLRTEAPLWGGLLAMDGHTVGLRYQINGIGEEFQALSGFISRPGVVHALFTHRAALYGRRGGFLERLTLEVPVDLTWRYREFVAGDASQDRKLHFNLDATFRGGWSAGVGYLVESFGYPYEIYTDHAVEVPGPGGAGKDTVAFTGGARIPNRDYLVSLGTPRIAGFSVDGFLLWGHDENYFEWASGDIVYAQGNLLWRPTEKLRVTGSYLLQSVHRRRDGSMVSVQQVPRLKVEYQIARPAFVRVVGEYASEQRDSLRDETRTGEPLLIFDSSVGNYVRTAAFQDNRFRVDVLFSYQPVPGTVVFMGYGRTMQEPEALSFRDLQRTADGFFVKLSYLFRV
jgi:hypothetical protein